MVLFLDFLIKRNRHLLEVCIKNDGINLDISISSLERSLTRVKIEIQAIKNNFACWLGAVHLDRGGSVEMLLGIGWKVDRVIVFSLVFWVEIGFDSDVVVQRVEISKDF